MPRVDAAAGSEDRPDTDRDRDRDPAPDPAADAAAYGATLPQIAVDPGFAWMPPASPDPAAALARTPVGASRPGTGSSIGSGLGGAMAVVAAAPVVAPVVALPAAPTLPGDPASRSVAAAPAAVAGDPLSRTGDLVVPPLDRAAATPADAGRATTQVKIPAGGAVEPARASPSAPLPIALAIAMPAAPLVIAAPNATPSPSVQGSSDPLVDPEEALPTTPRRRMAATAPLRNTADLPIVTRATPLASAPIAGTTASAFHIFSAMRAAIVREGETSDAAVPAMPQQVAPTAAIAAAGDAGHAPLDMSDARWPHAMIDRIELLRDAADAADTRIRLVPDALGAVDVSVKRDGDTLHVHFAAEQAATRALIHDAQPRLAALAQERGLTLGQTAVDAGAAGPGPGQFQGQGWNQQRQPTPEEHRPAAPHGATLPDATDPAATGRLA